MTITPLHQLTFIFDIFHTSLVTVTLPSDEPPQALLLLPMTITLPTNTEFLNYATRGILEGLKLVPSLFQDWRSGQTPSLHHSLPTKLNSLHALNMSFISENIAVQSLRNSLQVMPYTILEKNKCVRKLT